ncbi:MAG: ABC transporter ATP-binding protein [Thermoplasmata archaeon]|nr:ABC transporter ATP-binding protein [Thermoplasmata archaeon]
MNAIEVRNLTKRFNSFTAVDHVDFDVKKGEIFGLLGPNGAGKSTTMRMLCTLTRPSEGTAKVAGYDIIKEDARVREHIGLVAEKLIMYNDLTAWENLRLYGKLYNLPEDKLEKRIDKLLKFVRMEKWKHKRVGTFSTGMKQKINVIRAMIHEPEILFLDEPTLGLDPQSTVEIRELVRRINIEQGTTMILTTHIMVEADMLCNRVGIIDRGKIVALDTPSNLKKLVSGTDTLTMEFEIPNLTTELLGNLKSVDFVVSVLQEDATHVKVRAKGEDSFDRLLDLIRKNNGKIKIVKNLEPTLEDVFIHLTGREIREDTKKASPRRRPPWGNENERGRR